MKHILNFLAGAIGIALIVSAVAGWVYLSFTVAYWLSGGELWGLFAGVVLASSGVGGLGFAASEAGKTPTES